MPLFARKLRDSRSELIPVHENAPMTDNDKIEGVLALVYLTRFLVDYHDMNHEYASALVSYCLDGRANCADGRHMNGIGL